MPFSDDRPTILSFLCQQAIIEIGPCYDRLADSNSALDNSAILLDDSKICTGNRKGIPTDL